MKHEDFGDHKFHSVQKQVRFIREGIDAHALEDSEEKDDRGEVTVKSDACETTIQAMTQEDMNALLEDGYKIDDDRLPYTYNKSSATDDTYQPVYKEG